MVSGDDPSPHVIGRDRAQLILVGAIAIGIVLIALTTVLNSAVFTENVGGGRAVETTGDVREFDREAIRNVRSIVIRVNHQRHYHDSNAHRTDLNESVERNVANYSRVLAETYADTGSVYVDVSYGDEPEFGSRILQDEDEPFSSNNGHDSWAVIDDPVEIGWFVMNVDVENVSRSDPVYVNFTDADGTDLNVSLRRTASGHLAVRSEIDGGNVSDVTCTPRNGRVLLDLLGGTSYSGDCTFNSTEHLDPVYVDLEIADGQHGHGKYDLVLNESGPIVTDVAPPCASSNEPCRGVVVWSANFTTHYRSGSVGYERTHDVSVYDR